MLNFFDACRCLIEMDMASVKFCHSLRVMLVESKDTKVQLDIVHI